MVPLVRLVPRPITSVIGSFDGRLGNARLLSGFLAWVDWLRSDHPDAPDRDVKRSLNPDRLVYLSGLCYHH
ncbi:hypothetical protein [uncultured Chloroflexus sp.]|uniref:hypothetical protein n=1 Tax=uncultured Chloroflexus sp. TaxID=214040 RepID=UPI002629C68F|nr:hypothetical protein [uncultured Chloroflexus sp.]